ncbi:MAG: dihydropteroate synthase-like protein [Promethearchaeota archaeon]
MIKIRKILIITGINSYPIIKKIAQSIKNCEIEVYRAQISVSAFISEEIVRKILNEIQITDFDLILLPGFIQWNTTALEQKYEIKIRKGPEFASDLDIILKNLDTIDLSNKIPANKLIEISGEKDFQEYVKEQYEIARKNITVHTFYINQENSDLMVGRNLPPPLIAEIVNCPEKSDKNILQKVKHYIESGADIIDIGCVSNKPNPSRIKQIIKLIRKNFNVLISIDSMVKNEIFAAVEEGVDMILSLDAGNYKQCLSLPKDIPIVILPTNINAACFPKDPVTRVKKLFELTDNLKSNGFSKLIADPLLETPISPGICPSLETYFCYKKKVAEENYKKFELPMFFGISNVVELMDVDSVGINGLLASIAIELDVGIVFTVEHSSKLMGGVKELKDSIKLNYLAKSKKTPPINLGLEIFRAKKKKSQKSPIIDEKNAIILEGQNQDYVPDKKGYFRIYINHYSKKLYVMFYTCEHKLLYTFIGENGETICKRIIQTNLTSNIYHLNYLGRELNKAELCLNSGKAYIQDE